MATGPNDLPPSLATALATPPLPLKSWQDGVAPAYISLLLSVVFLDQLAVGTLFVGGLGPAVVGAALAGLLAYWTLYYAPAMLGQAARRPLSVITTSAFGSTGSLFVPGLLLGLAHVLWFAVTINFATDYSLRGLAACGLLDPKHISPSIDGRIGPPGPLFIATALVWSLASAGIGTLAIRLIAAVMSVYPIFPALALGLAVLWAMPGVKAGPITAVPWSEGGQHAVVTMIQVVFGFLATTGLIAVDWGAASQTPRDVRLGGLVGITLGTPILACLALLIVAGANGREVATTELQPEAAAPAPKAAKAKSTRVRTLAKKPATPSQIRDNDQPKRRTILTLRETFSQSIGGKAGSALLLTFALALLGPASYSPFGVARQFMAIWPKTRRWAWSIAGAVGTWPFLITGEAGRVDHLFTALGIVFGPAVAAVSADYFRSRGRWQGPTLGINWAGMIAWAVGVLVGLLPWIGKVARLGTWSQFQPSVLTGSIAAFATYLIVASIGIEPKRIELGDGLRLASEPPALP